jgi:hypothetical protein
MATKHRQNQNKPKADSAANAAVQARPKETEVPHAPNNAPAITSFAVMIAHITWFFIGPMVLLLTLFSIVNAGTGWATVLDIVFFVLVGLTVWCRWFDQRSGQATNSYGEPATWADCRRYMLWLPVVAGVAWVVANVIGNHFMTMWGG